MVCVRSVGACRILGGLLLVACLPGGWISAARAAIVLEEAELEASAAALNSFGATQAPIDLRNQRPSDEETVLNRAMAGQMSETNPAGATNGIGSFLPPIHPVPPSPLVSVLFSDSGVRLPAALESGLFRPPRSPVI